MDHSKKILILYASAGHGHEKAAKAILEACRELRFENAQAVDTISLVPPFFGNLYRQTYLFMIQYVPWLWGIFYYLLDVNWVYAVMRWVRRLLNASTAGRLEQFILKEKPDTIIATHFLSVEVASHLKEKNKINSKIISVVTDYLPHHVWMAKCVDLYAVALPETKKALMRWNVPASKIEVTGIPVEKKFLESLSISDARTKLALDPNTFTVLITSGGAGIGSMKNIAEDLLALKKPIQMLAVCGTNQNLFKVLNLKASENSSLKVFGFVSNMQELMAASDMVIGKGGGLTLTESFSKGKPMILFQSIPGQEARNVFCVRKYGAGLAASSLGEVIRAVSDISASPEKLDAMKKGVNAMYKGNASKRIAELA